MEKAVVNASPSERTLLIDEILNPLPSSSQLNGLGSADLNGSALTSSNSLTLVGMIKNDFANYVVQRMLEFANPEQRRILIVRIRPLQNVLRKCNYGKHIIAKLEKYNNVTGLPIITTGTNTISSTTISTTSISSSTTSNNNGFINKGNVQTTNDNSGNNSNNSNKDGSTIFDGLSVCMNTTTAPVITTASSHSSSKSNTKASSNGSKGNNNTSSSNGSQSTTTSVSSHKSNKGTSV